MITNGLDPAGEADQIASVQKALLRGHGRRSRGQPADDLHTTLYGMPSNDPITTFAPAIVGFFAYFFVYLLTGVSFLRERTGGTLERLMATPVTRGEVVAGYTLGFGLFATIQVALLMVWVLGTVHVPAIGPAARRSRSGSGVAVAGSPVAGVPRRRAPRRRRGEPGHLPVDVRPHRAPGHPVHPARARRRSSCSPASCSR